MRFFILTFISFAASGFGQLLDYPLFTAANVTFDPRGFAKGLAATLSATQNISENPCNAELLYGLNHFLDTHDRSIFTFLSYTGGPLNEVGDYRNCRAHGGKFFHMMVFFSFPLTMNGLCLPNVCTVRSLTTVRQSVADILRAMTKMPITVNNVAVYDIEALNEHYFQTTSGVIVTYTILAVLGALCIIGTVYMLISKGKTATGVRRVARCFDLVGNFTGLFACENAVDPNLNVLNGVRVLGMGWVIFGHTFEVLVGLAVPILNLIPMMKLILSSRNYATYAAGTLSVDVFFFLTGFLGALVCDHQLKSSPRGKIITALMMYLHRFVRIVPLYGLVILFGHTILPTIYDGPLYFQIGGLIDNSPCKRNWYLNILFINNFVEPKNNCLGWSWYLSNDFQMYLLIPWLCMLYTFRKLFALLAVTMMLVASAICQIVVFRYYDISVNIVKNNKPEYRSEYYIKTYCRVAPFLIGILFAWMYQSHKSPERGLSAFVWVNKRIVGSRILRYAMYLIGMAAMWCCVYLFFEFYKTDANMTRASEIVYAILSRPGFVLGMMLLVYPAILGKGRVTQRVLGHELFGFMAKLTFAAYLFHPYVTIFYYVSMEESIYFTGRKIVIIGLEAVALSYAVAMALALFVEYPTTLLSKEYLRPARKPAAAIKEKAKAETENEKKTGGIQ